ncbi:hypothetical protein LTR08_004877 [Meristemomyces frigidus]|nr:hypothetical protein LTR08_004877 [Meristemomyces frigidus]
MDLVPLTRFWRSRSSTAVTGENINPLYDPHQHQQHDLEPDLRDLNASLAALVEVFPDIAPEVFREMLSSISKESRIEVVTEQLLKKDAKLLRGRYRIGRGDRQSTSSPTSEQVGNAPTLATEETFRGESYRNAVKQVFYEEFKTLSHSSIKAVTAEQNYSYTLSRPVLQQLAAKSWRFSLANFWSKRSQSQTAPEHPNIVCQVSRASGETAALGVKRTGSTQLDRELWQLFVEPALASQRREQLIADHTYASKLNEAEAEDAGALFDCECCFGSVSFERMVTCDEGCHQLCFDCVRRTVNEALYGQGWARTVYPERSTVRCFAPTSQECHGAIPTDRVCYALSDADGSHDIWQQLQGRVASEALIKTVQLIFLSFLAAAFVFTVPLLLFTSVIWMMANILPPVAAIFHASWVRVHRSRQGLRFKCLNPSCTKTSCARCATIWRNPHICFETEKTSLRTAIESSATAAIKRTCPRCLLSFVKSSGCNKLVCNCGYTMCYICRNEITSKEGYSHFCQHFRARGGRCSECERCDLYGDEDEEAAIRRAAESAEKAWRDQGGKGDANTQLMVEALVGQAGHGTRYEKWLDAMVDAIAL